MSTPSFEDWLADRDANGIYVDLVMFLHANDADLYKEWQSRLERKYRYDLGLAEPDPLQDWLDRLEGDLADALTLPPRNTKRVKHGIEIFSKLKSLWLDEMKKNKDDPHYPQLYRLLETTCTELMGLQIGEMGVHL